MAKRMQTYEVMPFNEGKETKEKRSNEMKSLNSLVDATHGIQCSTVECSRVDHALNIRKAKKASKIEKSEKKGSKHKKRKKRHAGESISQHNTANMLTKDESGGHVSDVQELGLPTITEAETPEDLQVGVCHDVQDLKSFEDDQFPKSEFQRQQFEVYRRLKALSAKSMSNKKMSRDLQMSQGEMSSTEFSIVSDITSDSHPIEFYGMKSNTNASKINGNNGPPHPSTTRNNTKSMRKAAILEEYDYDQAESQICYTEDQRSHSGSNPSLIHEKWETLDEDADEAISHFMHDSNHELEQSTKLSCGIGDSQTRIHDKSYLITYLKSVGVNSTVARRIAEDFENDPGMNAIHRNVREATEYSQSTGATDTETISEVTPAIRKMREATSTSQIARRQVESNLTRRSNRPRSSLNWVRYSSPGVVQVDSRAFGAPYRHQDTITELEGNDRYDEKPLEAELVEAKIFNAQDIDIDIDQEAAILYVESEPLSFKSLMKERSFCLIFTIGICLLLVTLITLSVTLTKSSGEYLTPTEEPSFSPTSQPTRIDEDFFDAVAVVSGLEPLLNEGSPQRKALSWMSSIDEARLKPNDFSFLQRYSLIVIYYATGGEKFWTEKEGWLNASMHECDWGLSTIECVQNAADRRSVIALDLSRQGLNGKIPLEIGLLTSATAINLSKNGLHGAIPTTIFQIPTLNRLEINGNLITGIIPSQISLARGLSYLDMSYNDLKSSLPSDIYTLTNLFWLDLSVNKLTGSLASNIGKLSLLTSINLRHNLIGGTIPNAFDYIPKLDFILLDDNLLTGTLPQFSEQFVTRQEMTISNNHVGGTIPDVEDLKTIGGDVLSQIRLKKVDISYNDLTGTLPFVTALIPSLVYLDISGNAITGQFPVGGVGSWPSIEHLAAKDCNFGGPLPFHFSGLLTSLDLSGNNLTGGIPSEFSMYKDLKSLSLSHNPLFSSLPKEIMAMTQLEVLRIRNCSLHGMLPLGLSLFSAKEIDFGVNRLDGAMDEKLGYLYSLEILNLEYNNFTDSIPSELGRLTLLSTLNLANNMLTGTLPSELGNLSYLESFSVANNSLNGSIPGSFCAIMTDLSMNEIDCTLICECCSEINICN